MTRWSEEEFRQWREQQERIAAEIAGDDPSGAARHLPLTGEAKTAKYRNVRVEVDGLRFDSKHEAAVYTELMARVRAGELRYIVRQPRFDLGGGRNASRETRYQYVADFLIVDKDGRARVLDAKSEITRRNRTYINKRKAMLAEWGIEVEEV